MRILRPPRERLDGESLASSPSRPPGPLPREEPRERLFAADALDGRVLPSPHPALPLGVPLARPAPTPEEHAVMARLSGAHWCAPGFQLQAATAKPHRSLELAGPTPGGYAL